MKEIKEQKGITLIALIITVVVLLILATVTITSMTKYNIIDNANSASEKYQNKVDEEGEILSNYNQIVNDYLEVLNKENSSEDLDKENGSEDEQVREITFTIAGVTYKVPERLELGLVGTV